MKNINHFVYATLLVCSNLFCILPLQYAYGSCGILAEEDALPVLPSVGEESENRQLIDVNRVFFTGSLNDHVKKGIPGDEQNKNQYFDYATGWDSVSDTLVWGIDVVKSGDLSIAPSLGLPACQKGSVIEITLDGVPKELAVLSTKGFTTFAEQPTVRFKGVEAGRHIVKMAFRSRISPDKEVAYVQGIYAAGSAAAGLKPVVLRWRPAAIHCRWQNSSCPENIEIAVHEITVKRDFVHSYSPIPPPRSDISVLLGMPLTGRSAVLNFKVNRFGTDPVVKLYWGTEDGLTFFAGNKGNGGIVKWQHTETLSPDSEIFSCRLAGLSPDTRYYYRLQIVNREGGCSRFSMQIQGSEDAPALSPAFVIKDWNADHAQVRINGTLVQDTEMLRCGYRQTDHGTDLIIWINREFRSRTDIEVSR